MFGIIKTCCLWFLCKIRQYPFLIIFQFSQFQNVTKGHWVRGGGGVYKILNASLGEALRILPHVFFLRHSSWTVLKSFSLDLVTLLCGLNPFGNYIVKSLENLTFLGEQNVPPRTVAALPRTHRIPMNFGHRTPLL